MIDTQTMAAVDLPDTPPPDLAIWTCVIGEIPRADLPEGADQMMRGALGKAYRAVTGRDDDFTFSGWGSKLDESYRAVVEDRDPDPVVNLAEVDKRRAWIIEELFARDQANDVSLADRVERIRREIGQGAPEDWRIEQFAALVTVKLAQAITCLTDSPPDFMRREGRENLLAAAAALLDAAERYQ
jgi:hypothetical protein